MSSVWLTARAVRYMTCKLLRARPARDWEPRQVEIEDLAPLLLAHAPRTMREPSPGWPRADDVDLVGQVRSAALARIGEEHQRAADLHAVAAGQLVLLDAAAVDERAVGAGQVGELVDFSFAANLGVPPRDFRIVHQDRVRSVATETDNVVFQLESGALISTLNDE